MFVFLTTRKIYSEVPHQSLLRFFENKSASFAEEQQAYSLNDIQDMPVLQDQYSHIVGKGLVYYPQVSS